MIMTLNVFSLGKPNNALRARLASLILTIAALTLLVQPWPALAGGGEDADFNVQETLDQILADHPLFSGSAVVARSGKIVAEIHAGYQDRDAGVLNSASTFYSIGSIGKMFTAAAIAQMAGSDLFALDTPVVALIPELKNQIPETVTIDHLLGHRSGLDRMIVSDEDLEGVANNHEKFELFAASGASSEGPGEFAYRNENYLILGEIVERVSGLSYEAYIRRNIAGPSGLTGPVFPNGKAKSGRALPYMPVDFETWWNSENQITGENADAYVHVAPITRPSAGGGHVLTARDLFQFLNWLRSGREDGTVSLMDIICLAPAPTDLHYLRGCSINVGPYGLRVGHTGSTAGVHARAFYYDKLDIDVVVLSNHDGQASPLFKDIERKIVEGIYR